MTEKQIYISNEPVLKNNALETAMIRIAEELGMKIMVKDFAADSGGDAAPVIIMCDGINVQSETVLENIEKQYFAGQHIILYKPTNNEINAVYNRLEGREYFKADNKVIGYSLFGLKRSEDGICYVLESHEKQPDALAGNMVDFLADKQELDAQALHLLQAKCSDAVGAGSADVNLATMAKQHVLTKYFELLGKHCSLSYYMVSCHEYKGTEDNGGEDWFFIQQYGILNGEAGYQKYWAGSRVDVNGGSWYVGQGEVCLNYVDYYKMKNYLPIPAGSDRNDVQLMYADPQAINGTTSYTVAESVDIGGTVGFEAGVGKDGLEAKGNGTFSIGANFTSSYTFEVQDCACKGISLSLNSSSAEWEYNFKRAAQNRASGKWQYLHDPAALSHSVFSPLNSWVWKIDTSKRDLYKSFVSKLEIGIMNTISRYSGSQSPKNIPNSSSVDDRTATFDITFTMPPLIGVGAKSLLFDKGSGTQRLGIAVQGTWHMEIAGAPFWIRSDQYEGSGDLTEVYISVDENKDGKTRQATLAIRRVVNNSKNSTNKLVQNKSNNKKTDEGELIEVKIIQSGGKINH